MESQPENNKEQIVAQEIIDRVRKAVIKDLEESIEIYTKNGTQEWKGKEKAEELISGLRNKNQIILPGSPIWQEGLAHAIQILEGIDPSDPRYNEIWDRVLRGE